MKYKEFNGLTIRGITKEDDPYGVRCILGLDDALEGTLELLTKNPAIQPLFNKDPIVEILTYGCPVCGDLYFKKEQAEACYKQELDFLEKFKGAKVGDWLKYEVKKENSLDCWGDLSVGDVFYQQITGFTTCYSGYYCGRIFTIMADGDAINAESMERWSLTTAEEVVAHKKAMALKQIAKLQADLDE